MQRNDLRRIRAILAERGAGPFHLRDLYGAGWDQFDIGTRVRLGNDFLRAVRQGALPGVTDSGTKRWGGRLYHHHPEVGN